MNYAVDFSDPLVIVESRRVNASAHDVFEVLRDPKRHQEFDGSSMVRDSDAPVIEAVGDAFVMRMHNEKMGDYEMRNEVVAFEIDQALAWAPKRHDVEGGDDWDHRWGWYCSDEPSTLITAYFDCTRVPDDIRRYLNSGEWARPILRSSLDRLEAIFKP